MTLIYKVKKIQKPIDSLSFYVHKFNNRPKPEDKDCLVICSFSEFGCETISVMYAVPFIQNQNPGKYTIVIGWYGRQYLYKHLADEFWEIKEDFQYLRDFCKAFHHQAKDLLRFEAQIKSQFGKVYTSVEIGFLMTGNTCNNCGFYWGNVNKSIKCPSCNSLNININPFGNVREAKKKAKRVPFPSQEKIEYTKKIVKENNLIAVFARGRKTYGRNLQPEFYVNLLKILREKGFYPIWLGEKQCTQACPVEDMLDFSRMPESRDLEMTLALISRCKYTIQFWTASTRLAAFVNVPYLIFESPDQIIGNGHEGYRQELTTFTNKKVVYAHFLNIYENNQLGLNLAKQALEEMDENNWEDIIGSVENRELIENMRKNSLTRIGRLPVKRNYAAFKYDTK